MQKILLLSLVSLTLVACDRHDNKKESAIASAEDADNSGRNVRDRNNATTTPLDQSESETDRMITKKIRQAILADDSLSTNAKNIKVITMNGAVILRGPVANSKEKELIAKKIDNIQGIVKVDNQLEITNNQ